METARLWRSLGHHDSGTFRIDGVTGPDEYSAIADNNVYTNLMAQQNLRCGRRRWPSGTRTGPGTSACRADEIAAWRAAADGMLVPYDEKLRRAPAGRGVHRARRSGTSPAHPRHEYPLLLALPYFDLYRKQVVKQADLVLAMQLCPDAFTAEQKARNFVYYEALTVRDSSLSACTQAVLAAETGHLDLAHDYLAESALMDLADLEHNTRDGLHLAALAGAWIALVAGFGGMR